MSQMKGTYSKTTAEGEMLNVEFMVADVEGLEKTFGEVCKLSDARMREMNHRTLAGQKLLNSVPAEFRVIVGMILESLFGHGPADVLQRIDAAITDLKTKWLHEQGGEKRDVEKKTTKK